MQAVHSNKFFSWVSRDLRESLVAVQDLPPVMDRDTAEGGVMQGPEALLALLQLPLGPLALRYIADHAVIGYHGP